MGGQIQRQEEELQGQDLIELIVQTSKREGLRPNS